MGSEKGVIVKSVSLERTEEFERFVACQKNFSRSIRVLIQQAIFQHNGAIVDIWEEYEKAVRDSVFRNQMSSVSGIEERVDRYETASGKTSMIAEPKYENPAAAVGNITESREEPNEDSDIPEGYQ